LSPGVSDLEGKVEKFTVRVSGLDYIAADKLK
jgi:hypothetical protein